jgi:hypothetical protein
MIIKKGVRMINERETIVGINEFIFQFPCPIVLVYNDKIFINDKVENLIGYSQNELTTLNDWIEKLKLKRDGEKDLDSSVSVVYKKNGSLLINHETN